MLRWRRLTSARRSRRRRRPMLEIVALTVADSSITAVLGANGAGKTTLVRTISGLVRARSGSVRLDGRDLTRLAPEESARLGVGHVPQGQAVLAELTVDENLRLGGLWRRGPSGQRRALAEAYELFPPLASRRHLAAFSLSGGERQMLVIGRALTGAPPRRAVAWAGTPRARPDHGPDQDDGPRARTDRPADRTEREKRL